MSFENDLDRQREQVMRRVRQASNAWADAMRAHKLAPPDTRFARRLEMLAEAATDERIAWEQAHAAGLQWRPVPGAESAEPPYELRPGTGRRGPANLWARFDAAVAALNRAITQTSAAVVSDAFAQVADTASALAVAVAQEDAATNEKTTRRAPPPGEAAPTNQVGPEGQVARGDRATQEDRAARRRGAA